VVDKEESISEGESIIEKIRIPDLTALPTYGPN